MANVRPRGEGLHHGGYILKRQFNHWGGGRQRFAVTALPFSPKGHVFDKPAPELATVLRPFGDVAPPRFAVPVAKPALAIRQSATLRIVVGKFGEFDLVA